MGYLWAGRGIQGPRPTGAVGNAVNSASAQNDCPSPRSTGSIRRRPKLGTSFFACLSLHIG